MLHTSNQNSELFWSKDYFRSSETNLASLYSPEEPLHDIPHKLHCGLVFVPAILTCDINILLLYIT